MLAIHQTRFFTAGLPSASKSVECPESRLLFSCGILHQPDFVGNPLSCIAAPLTAQMISAFKTLKTGTSAFLSTVNRVGFQRILS
jgi:hypothetical protein